MASHVSVASHPFDPLTIGGKNYFGRELPSLLLVVTALAVVMIRTD
jgi:hypothetical protein